MRSVFSILPGMVILFTLAACSGGGSSDGDDTTNDGSGGVTPPSAGITPPSIARFAFVLDQLGHSLATYVVNASSGRLKLIGTASTGFTPTEVAISPNDQYAYVVNFDSDSISQYSIGADGSVTPLTSATSSEKLPAGKSTVKMEFNYDGGKPGAGGMATLYIDGKSVGSTRIDKTQFAIFSADETAGVGLDAETPVSEDYTRSGSKFTGSIHKVAINLK